MSAPASPFPHLPDVARCMMCKRPHAAFGVSWSGLPSSQPDRVRGKTVRVCAHDGECHAQAIVRAARAAGFRFPFPLNASPALVARVGAILAEVDPPPVPPPSPPPVRDQPTLL